MNIYQNCKFFPVLIYNLDYLFCNFIQISCNLTISSNFSYCEENVGELKTTMQGVTY